MKRMKRRYSEKFKQAAVRRVLGGSVSRNQVAKDLGTDHLTLSKWIKKYEESGSTISFDKDASVAMRNLKAENKRLTEEIEILTKARNFSNK